MNTIPERVVERTWSRVNECTPEDVKGLLDQMIAAQPLIGAYLMAVEEVLMAEEERGELLLIGLIAWQVLLTGQPRIRAVTQEEIDAAESANIRFVEQLEEGSEMDQMDELGRLLTTYNQAPLLKAVLEALTGEGEEVPDNMARALLHLKTVVDCLDRAGTPGAPAKG